MSEKWVPIRDYEGLYEVSNLGNFRGKSGPKKCVLNKRLNRPQITLFDGRKTTRRRRTYYPHTLVMESFLVRRPPGTECCHNDGDPWNNRLSNLRWGTRRENCADTALHGTRPVGMRHGQSKLTDDQVSKIRSDGRVQRLIAADFGVSQSVVSQIKSRRYWSHIV